MIIIGSVSLKCFIAFEYHLDSLVVNEIILYPHCKLCGKEAAVGPVTATQLYKVFMGGQAPMIPILPIRPDSSFYVAIYIGC